MITKEAQKSGYLGTPADNNQRAAAEQKSFSREPCVFLVDKINCNIVGIA